MSDYAVMEAGGRQFRVSAQDVISIHKLGVEAGKQVEFDKVLLLKAGTHLMIGSPFVAGAKVTCEVLGDEKLPKIISYRFKRRKNERRKRGSRPVFTKLQVKSIQS